MNQLRVANKQERVLFEQTIQTDLNKIPNVHSNVYGRQQFSPLVPNNQFENQHSHSHNSQYRQNYDNNNGYNKVLKQEHQPNLNQRGNFINQQREITPNQTNIPFNSNTSVNNPDIIKINNKELYFNTSNNHNIRPYANSNKTKSKRDFMWELKKQKTMQGGGNNMMDHFQKKIIDNSNLRFDVTSPDKQKQILDSNKLNSYSNLNNQIHSGASADEIRRTPNPGNINSNGNYYPYNNNHNYTNNKGFQDHNGFNNYMRNTPTNDYRNDMKNVNINNNINGGDINYSSNIGARETIQERRRTPFENSRTLKFDNVNNVNQMNLNSIPNNYNSFNNNRGSFTPISQNNIQRPNFTPMYNTNREYTPVPQMINNNIAYNNGSIMQQNRNNPYSQTPNNMSLNNQSPNYSNYDLNNNMKNNGSYNSMTPPNYLYSNNNTNKPFNNGLKFTH